MTINDTTENIGVKKRNKIKKMTILLASVSFFGAFAVINPAVIILRIAPAIIEIPAIANPIILP